MKPDPLVSVIIIFLDAEAFIQESIESVFAQTYTNWELLLVDDGSTDGSTEIAMRFARSSSRQVRYFEHEGHRNLGMSAARNLGLRNASGEYVAFLDADDRYSVSQLEQQVAILRSRPEAAATYGGTRYWYSWDGETEESLRDFETSISAPKNVLIGPPALFPALLLAESSFFCMCSFMAKREVFELVGGFEEQFRGLYEDMVFHAKVFLRFPVLLVDESWGWYRQHRSSANALAGNRSHPYVPRLARETFLRWLVRYLSDHGVRDDEAWRVLRTEQRLCFSALYPVFSSQMEALGKEPELSGKEDDQAGLVKLLSPLSPVTGWMGRQEERKVGLMEVAQVVYADLDQERLWGRSIDVPTPGAVIVGSVIDIDGWALGRETPVVAVEVVHAGAVIRRVPMNLPRPDVAADYPDVPGAAGSGFQVHVSLLQLPRDGELQVRAVLQTQARVPLGTIHLRWHWLEGDDERAGAPPLLPDLMRLGHHLIDDVPVGHVRFGDLRRLIPISLEFGYDRGSPIDRHYIERFLELHAADITGHVLEVDDDTYIRRFGGDRVSIGDVLHVDDSNPLATIVADLASADHIPSETFDCIILTQTLHLIFDVRAAVATLYRILKPGGVLLVTVPGITPIARDQWGKHWYWSFTALSAERLFTDVFPSATTTVEAHGNVLAAIAFLAGLATQELDPVELDFDDPFYQLLITVRATRPLASSFHYREPV